MSELSVVSYQLSDLKNGHNYRQLKVWQKSIEFTKAIYKITKKFPKDEMFALSSQLKRAAVSVPSNIAEGSVKRSNKDFVRFLNIAYGSIAEIDTQIIIAAGESYITETELNSITIQLFEIRKMIDGLRKSLKTKSDN